MNNNSDKLSRGFTLLELLVVIAIIGILAGLSYTGMNRHIESGKKRRAKADALVIAQSIKAYRAYYGKWPAQTATEPSDKTYDGGAGKLHSTILDPLTPNPTTNPRNQTFIEVPPNSIDTNGSFLDPWKEPYIITLDLNGDNTNNISSLSLEVANETVTVFTKANSPSETNKWICSWK